METLTDKQIVEDLESFKKHLYKSHPNPFTFVTREEFELKLNSIVKKYDKISVPDFEIELMKILTLLKDGHTMVIQDIKEAGRLYIPLELKYFKDGYYVIDAKKGTEAFLGLKLVSINGFTVKDLENKIGALIGLENETSLKTYFPSYITQQSVLEYFKISTDSKSKIVLRDSNGKAWTEEFIAKEINDIYWIKPETKSKDGLETDSTYSLREYPQMNTLYFQYNSCEERDNYPIKKVVDDMKTKEYKDIVIDLRNNKGGDEDTLIPVIDYLADVCSKTRTVVLVSEETFSSAVNNLVTIKTIPNSVAIGNTPHGAPTHYGEPKILVLKNSDTWIQCSTRYFERKGYKLGESFKPDILIQPTIQDYLNGKDVVWNSLIEITN